MEAIKEKTQEEIDKANKYISIFGRITIFAILLLFLSFDKTAPEWVFPLGLFARGFALIFFVKAFYHFYKAINSHEPKSPGI